MKDAGIIINYGKTEYMVYAKESLIKNKIINKI